MNFEYFYLRIFEFRTLIGKKVTCKYRNLNLLKKIQV